MSSAGGGHVSLSLAACYVISIEKQLHIGFCLGFCVLPFTRLHTFTSIDFILINGESCNTECPIFLLMLQCMCLCLYVYAVYIFLDLNVFFF